MYQTCRSGRALHKASRCTGWLPHPWGMQQRVHLNGMESARGMARIRQYAPMMGCVVPLIIPGGGICRRHLKRTLNTTALWSMHKLLRIRICMRHVWQGKSASLWAVHPMDASPGGCCGDGTKCRGGCIRDGAKVEGGKLCVMELFSERGWAGINPNVIFFMGVDWVNTPKHCNACHGWCKTTYPQLMFKG